MTGSIYLISGASRGIGFALVSVILLKDDDSFVYAGARDVDNVNSALKLKELQGKYPQRMAIVECVSADEEGNRALAKVIEMRHGKVDAVIANAGISVDYGSAVETPLSAMEEHYRINVLGPLALFQATYHLLNAASSSSSPPPRFIPISSGIGSLQGHQIQRAKSGLYPYGTSKAALNWMTRKIHFENEWIVAFPLAPGVVRTDMLLEFLAKDTSGTMNSLLDLAAEPVQAANMLLDVISNATRETHGGEFYDRDGKKVVW